MNALTPKEIQDILDGVMQDVPNRIASIQLQKQDTFLSNNVNNLCTIHTTFEGGYHASLALCADACLLMRLTQHFMQEEIVTSQDIEDFAKEYLNIICGRIVAGLFRSAHISSRFHIPSFSLGRYIPDDVSSCCILNYTSNCNEGVQLIHQTFPLENSAQK